MLFVILSAVTNLIKITYHLSNTIDSLELSKKKNQDVKEQS
jgi:hypothetical protein